MTGGISRPNRFNRLWVKIAIALGILVIGVSISFTIRSSIPVAQAVKPIPPNLVYFWGGSLLDSELGYRPKPWTWSRQFYIDNPRGYFHEASLEERQFNDWRLTTSDEFSLCVKPADATFPLTFKLQASQPNLPDWKVAFRHEPMSVPAHSHAQLVVSGFATSPRKIHVLFWPAGDWNNPFSSREIVFDTQRQRYVIDFPDLEKEARIIAGVDLGGASGEFEIDELMIQGLDAFGRGSQKQYFVDNVFNQWGYRDSERSLEPASGITRVACIGDSFTFAQGVKQNERFTEVLESLLNTGSTQDQRFEVLNFGLCGYSTNEEWNVLRRDVVRFLPKIVVLTMCWNDSVFLHRELELSQTLKNSPEKFSQEYSNFIKSERFQNCIAVIEQMNSFCKDHDIRFVVGIFNTADTDEWKLLSREILPAMKERGITSFDVREELIAGKCFGIDSSVHSTDHHPNEKAQAIYAQKLADVLRKDVLPEAP